MALLYLGAGADVATMFHNDLMADRQRIIMVDARPDEDAALSTEITRQLRMFKLIGPADEPKGQGEDSYDWRLIDGGTLTLFANTHDSELEDRVQLNQVDALVINRVKPANDKVFDALPFLATVHATPTGVDAVPTDYLGLVDLVDEGQLNSDDEWVVEDDEFDDLPEVGDRIP